MNGNHDKAFALLNIVYDQLMAQHTRLLDKYHELAMWAGTQRLPCQDPPSVTDMHRDAWTASVLAEVEKAKSELERLRERQATEPPITHYNVDDTGNP